MLRFLNIPSATLTNSLRPRPEGSLDSRTSCMFITDTDFHREPQKTRGGPVNTIHVLSWKSTEEITALSEELKLAT